MLSDRPQLRFLLRASTLLIGMLVLWRVALADPLLILLRGSAEYPLRWLSGGAFTEPIRVMPGAGWTFQVPLPPRKPAAQAQQSGQPGAGGASPRTRSIRLTLPEARLVMFTFSLPAYWAIVLAAGWRNWRALLWGSAVLEAVAVLSLLLLILYTICSQLLLARVGLARWLLEYAQYLSANVVPYLAPIVVAVCLHRELRTQIFSWETPGPPAKAPVVAQAKRRRAKASR